MPPAVGGSPTATPTHQVEVSALGCSCEVPQRGQRTGGTCRSSHRSPVGRSLSRAGVLGRSGCGSPGLCLLLVGPDPHVLTWPRVPPWRDPGQGSLPAAGAGRTPSDTWPGQRGQRSWRGTAQRGRVAPQRDRARHSGWAHWVQGCLSQGHVPLSRAGWAGKRLPGVAGTPRISWQSRAYSSAGSASVCVCRAWSTLARTIWRRLKRPGGSRRAEAAGGGLRGLGPGRSTWATGERQNPPPGAHLCWPAGT